MEKERVAYKKHVDEETEARSSTVAWQSHIMDLGQNYFPIYHLSKKSTLLDHMQPPEHNGGGDIVQLQKWQRCRLWQDEDRPVLGSFLFIMPYSFLPENNSALSKQFYLTFLLEMDNDLSGHCTLI